MKKNLPPEIQSVLHKKGIITSEAQLFLKTDMGREAFFCDAYTVATSEGIAALFCLKATEKDEGASFFSPIKSKEVLKEFDYFFLPFSEIRTVKCEEQISTLRLVVEKNSGEEECLFFATASCRKKLFDFCEKVQYFKEHGVFPDEQERIRDELCPICHRPYSDPERKICKS